MKAAFLLLGRDKAPFVEEAARSVLDQVTDSPLEILFSDQGSTDGTRDILASLASDYEGPHDVRVLDCPHTEERGIPGINAHLNWGVEQSDADVFIVTSADDYNYPTRAQKVLTAFAEHQPASVLTAIEFVEADGTIKHTAHPAHTGFVPAADIIKNKIAGSSSMAFDRRLYEDVAPLKGALINDVALGYFAACSPHGCLFLRDPLYRYYRRADAGNAGLEGRYRATTDEAGEKQTLELIRAQLTETYRIMIETCQERWGAYWKPEDAKPLWDEFCGQAAQWARLRWEMDEAGIRPALYRQEGS